MGVRAESIDPRVGGRVGNGACTICHTHASRFDVPESVEEKGWIRGRLAEVPGVPNPLPTVFALSRSERAAGRVLRSGTTLGAILTLELDAGPT